MDVNWNLAHDSLVRMNQRGAAMKMIQPFRCLCVLLLASFISPSLAFSQNHNDQTVAHFDLLGQDGVYLDIGYNTKNDTYNYGEDGYVSARHLTQAPKDIRITFSRAVERASVESSIRQGLKDKPELMTFRWIDDRTLLFHLDAQGRKDPENLPERFYQITLKQARDARGNPVHGGISFYVNEPCRLSRIDLLTRQVRPVRQFRDKIYMSFCFPMIGRLTLLDDGRHEFLFDLHKGRLDPKPLPGWNDARNMCWLDESRYVKVLDNRLVLRNVTDGKETVVYDALPKGLGADAIALSPDRRKAALLMEPHLFVISIDGRMLYQSRDRIKLYQHEYLAPEAKLNWAGADALIYDALERPEWETTSCCNIYKLNLSTGQTETMIRNARKPAISPRGARVVFMRTNQDGVQTYWDYYAGRERELTSCHDRECENFLFLDENRMAFERDQSIILLDLDNNRESVPGAGAIIGLSPDRRHLYINSYKGDLHYRE